MVSICYIIGFNTCYWLSITYNHEVNSYGPYHEWAERLIGNTSDFHHWLWDKFLFHFIGGLNYHIEHHLFPTINHVHFYKIKPIVKKTCEEFSLTYNEFD